MNDRRKTDYPGATNSLRKRAEALLDENPVRAASKTGDDYEAIIQELNVHQVELEIQNEELRRAQVELADSRDRYADLYEFAPVGYVTLSADGEILKCNLTAASLLDLQREAMIGANMAHFVKPESQDTLYLHRQAVFSGNGGQSCHVEMKRPGDEPLFLRLESIALGASDKRQCRTALIESTDYVLAEAALETLNANLGQQVTERTAALQREQGFLDAILDNQSVVTLVLDTEGRIIRFNKACETASGYDFSEMKSFHWRKLIPDDERNAVERVFAELVSGRAPIIHENHWCCRDGSKRLFLWTNSTFEMDPGPERYIIASGLDITDQRRAEEEARRHLEEASRLQRLHTANELATMLAHELNQPFGAITTFADASRQLLEQERPDLDRLADNLHRISEEGLRGGEIIKRLRDFIKRGQIESEAVNLNAVIEHVCNLMNHKANDSNIRLSLDLCQTLPPVQGVEVHLEQIMFNLLRNAIEAIHDIDSADRLVTVETLRQGDMARVTIRDGGPGIDAGAAQKIFDFLHSTKDYGLGVGLRICSSLIEAHGGRLWVQAQQPGGIVHFEVPLAL